MQEDADLSNLGTPSVLAMVLLLVAARLLRETSDGSLQIPHILLDMSAVVLADEQDISNCVVDVNIRLYTGGTKTFGLKEPVQVSPCATNNANTPCLLQLVTN